MKNGLIVVAFLVLFGCNSNNVDKQTVLPDKISVESVSYQAFAAHVISTLGSLNETHKDMVSKYISQTDVETKKAINDQGARMEFFEPPKCSCSAGQSTCGVDALFSSCCVCCASGTSAGCGQWFGLAICKCGDNSSAREIMAGSTVVFYPNRFNEMLEYASKNDIEMSSLKEAFQDFVKANSK